jgi:hypothetical protein
LGENGCRKSLILRQILDNALLEMGGPPPAIKRSVDMGLTSFYRTPSRIIAISAAPTDRFPSKPHAGDPGSRYDTPAYRYLGPRTARNIVSRNQSLHEFLVAVLSKESKLKDKISFCRQMAEKTGIPKRFKFLVGYQSMVRNDWGNITIEALKSSSFFRRSKWLVKALEDSAFREEVNSYLVQLPSPKDDVRYASVRQSPFAVTVDADADCINTGGVNPQALYWGLTLGIMRVRGLEFGDTHSSNEHAPSAGQWGLFSSLVSLSLVADDDALILIDEPENTLHPRWQREYLEDVVASLSGYKGCQVILATHSPLIASALRRGRDHLVRLSNVDGQVDGELLDTPDGWTANDVLETAFELPTTRSVALAALIDRALVLIAQGATENRALLRQIEPKLTRYLELLPDGDVGRGIIRSISNVVSGTSGERTTTASGKRK